MVSIIVTCYKLAEYLPETLDSIMSQTYQEWECIIVDDGSPDNTREIANAYSEKDSRIKYIYQENHGVSVARNNGVANSTGEYILPLDADDIIAPTYLEKAVGFLDNHKDYKLVYCKAKLFGEINKDWLLPEYSYEELRWTNMIFNASVFRKTDFLTAGGYNENMKKGLEDWDFLLSLLGPKDIVFQIPETLFFYRIRKNSKTETAHKNDQYLKRQVFLNHPERYKDDIVDIINYHDRMMDLIHIKSTILYRIWAAISSPIKMKIKRY